MPTIRDQIKWEQECSRRGASNYFARQDRIRDKGRTEQTEAVQYIMRSRLQDIGDAINEDVISGKAGVQSKFNRVLTFAIQQGVTPLTLAFLGMQVVIQAISEGKRKNHNRVTKICGAIGERIETEVRCLVFEKTHPAFFDLILKDMQEDNVVSYRHKRKVVMSKLGKTGHNVDWGTSAKVGIGAKVLQMIELVMGDLIYITQINEKKRTVSILCTKPAFMEWCGEFEKERGLMQPSLLPLKIQPLDWSSDGMGGYYSPRMQFKFPFIKTKGKEHKEFINKYDPAQHILAVNKMQKTAWRINKPLLAIIDEVFREGLGYGIPSALPVVIPDIPEDLRITKDQYDEEQWEELKYWKAQAKSAYKEEATRKGRVIQFSSTLQLARELAEWDEFYYTYSCDFRGRVYCATTCLSPQSNELAKSLLLFKKEVTIGQDGVSWLALNGADKYGIKGTYEERLQWTNENRNMFYYIALDPIKFCYWAKADKPYQFLAWVLEWVRLEYGSNPEAKSSLVVGIDGSCNGLQHFSAILRDPVGARATNLCNDHVPQDIYQEVADKCVDELKLRDDGAAEVWLKVGIDRGTTKRQCMTLPYGATQQSCREYTHAWVKEHWASFDLPRHMRWKLASYMSPVIWEAIGKTVVAARVAMTWLQQNVGKRYSKWVSPVGFPVYQFYKKVKTERVDTRLAGKTKLTIHNMERLGDPNSFKQRLGIVPNFIHSIDASHMVMTVNATELAGYSMIHDEFGCHAGHIPILYAATRQQFYNLHYYCNPLEMWAIHQGIPLEYVPQRGTFDIAEVLSSKYIFG